MQDFRPYRFSPIQTKEELLECIKHIHFACYKLCHDAFGGYLPNAGNIGIFCHYDEEFEKLKKIRGSITEPSDNPELKYFTLREPITIPGQGNIPGATYTHLYIRKPDPYRYQTGDVDFFLPQDEYVALKESMHAGKLLPGARLFERPDLDMIELYNPDIDALGYVSTSTMSEKVRIKLSDATKL